MEMRRQPRIAYQSKVQLRAVGQDVDSVPVLARVQNLSPLGAFLTASVGDLPEVGREVLCQLKIAREERVFRGRVAWTRRPSKASPLKTPGLGVEFVGLRPQESDLLHRLVEPGDEKRQEVEVWFDGLGTPVTCQAVVAGESVRLLTRLPFLRLSSGVRIAFIQQPGGLVREGTLESLVFGAADEEGVPDVRLGVSMIVPDAAQGMITVRSRSTPPTPHGSVSPLPLPSLQQTGFAAGTTGTHRLLSLLPDPSAPSLVSAPGPPFSATLESEPPGLAPAPLLNVMRGLTPIILGGLAGALLITFVTWVWRNSAPVPEALRSEPAVEIVRPIAPTEPPRAGPEIELLPSKR